MLTTSAIFFLLPALAAAQYGYAPQDPSTPTTTAAAGLTVPSAPVDTPGQMNIDVGFQGTSTFHPANITAPVGTLVTFWFPTGTPHSVTQSSFASPCVYLAASSDSSAGFDSGLTTASTFTINITDTEPIWFHCKQAIHCPSGMVGSINAPASGNTFDEFKAAAISSKSPTETDNGPVTGGVHGVASAAPTSDTGSSSSGGTSGTTSSAAKVVAGGRVAILSAFLAILMA